jgi:NADH-quinone oxidoreductase subunit H
MLGWYVLGLKTVLILFVFLWARAAFPRFRYDQLMSLGWKVFLPLLLSFVLFTSGILFAIGGLPS